MLPQLNSITCNDRPSSFGEGRHRRRIRLSNRTGGDLTKGEIQVSNHHDCDHFTAKHHDDLVRRIYSEFSHRKLQKNVIQVANETRQDTPHQGIDSLNLHETASKSSNSDYSEINEEVQDIGFLTYLLQFLNASLQDEDEDTMEERPCYCGNNRFGDETGGFDCGCFP